jgi:hypothetical protein
MTFRSSFLKVLFYEDFRGKKEKLLIKNDEESSFCSGGRIRTSDLWVMSPTSYHCSTPQYRGANVVY